MKFPIEVKQAVAWGEMDAFEHVNNVTYFRYYENVRIAYFDALDYMAFGDEGPILANISCQFLKPLVYPDNITIKASVSEMRNTSFKMIYELHSERLGLAATGESIIVHFDYKKGLKAAIPTALKQQIEALEGRRFD